jgi:hypothetical protein
VLQSAWTVSAQLRRERITGEADGAAPGGLLSARTSRPARSSTFIWLSCGALADHAVWVEYVLAGCAVVELRVAVGCLFQGIGVALTFLAMVTRSCRMAIISCRL